jgi:hypothetical protein
MASKEIYQLYAELKDYSPKIWRRFEVVSNITIARLGYILMTLFEMQASHLFSFDVPFSENYRIRMAEKYSTKEIDKLTRAFFTENPVYRNLRFELKNEYGNSSPDAADAAEVLLKDTLELVGERIIFTYDFGDNWEVVIVLEKVYKDAAGAASDFPRVLEGSGFGIIEDCGGVPGLEDIASAYKKKSGRAYREYCEWLDMPDLDMDSFDLDDMNFRLKKLPKIFAEIYEKELAPTQQSIDLILREYKKR